MERKIGELGELFEKTHYQRQVKPKTSSTPICRQDLDPAFSPKSQVTDYLPQLTILSATLLTSFLFQTTSSAALLAGIQAFHPIKAQVGTNLCLQANSNAWGTAITLATCNPSNLYQLFAPLQDGNTASTIYRLQNGGSQYCLQLTEEPADGQILTQGECTLTDGTGRPVSNAQFNTSPLRLPNIAVLQSHIHFKDSGYCIDAGDWRNVVIRKCNGGLQQKWTIGF
ncbi:hypothetical protein B0O99DRAFT_687956 [Bisporella sp. PMI_857]|nr:hypothetical protein B0O99DRAFT_687956 [Bisporella sp. PMI_857]